MLPIPTILHQADLPIHSDCAIRFVSPSARHIGKARSETIEPNHYAVVTLDSAGQELCGWDFRKLDEAKRFGDQLRPKGLRVELWARDEFGRKLARLLPKPAHSSKRPMIPAGRPGPPKPFSQLSVSNVRNLENHLEVVPTVPDRRRARDRFHGGVRKG